MNRITIRNIGPVSHVETDLAKVNVIIGTQGSGKSTVAKIIGYCRWAEKRYVLDGDYKHEASERLSNFHQLEDGYFSDDSFFEYRGEYVRLSCTGKELRQTITPLRNEFDYRKSKNIYIPAERNFVSVIPNLGRYNETNDNVMSFVYDWYSAKRKFTRQNMLSILDLGIDFYSNEKTDADVLFHRENGREISLRSGSSGIQSPIPLIVNVEYLTRNIYEEDASMSVNETRALTASFEKHSFMDYTLSENPTPSSVFDAESMLKKMLDDVTAKRKSYHAANFIVEEPEQNLFPLTQRGFDLLHLQQAAIGTRTFAAAHHAQSVYSVCRQQLSHGRRYRRQNDAGGTTGVCECGLVDVARQGERL